MDLAGRIRTEREARQMSQEALARQAGMSLRALNSLERGEAVNPHYATLAGIADAFGMSISELLEEPVPLGEAPRDRPAESSAGAVEESEPDALAEIIRRLSAGGKEVAGSDAGSAELLRVLKFIDDVFGVAFHDYRTREARGVEAGGLARSLEELVAVSVGVEAAIKEAARAEADPGKKAQIFDFLEHPDRRGPARTLGLRQAEAG